MAAKNRPVSARHVGGIPEVPNGHGRSVERPERAAKESEDAYSGFY